MSSPSGQAKLTPILVGVGAVIIGLVIFKVWTDKKSSRGGAGKKKSRTDDSPKTLVDPTAKYLLPLMEKEEISHDTRRFRFALPSSDHVLGLPIGQHVNLIVQMNDEPVIRAYTPVSSDQTDRGYVDLVVKVYRPNERFPGGGKLSQYLDDMKIGDKMTFRGPSGRIQYQGCGKLSVKATKPRDPPTLVEARAVNMIAGGTGITPMLQLIRNILVTNAGRDKTKLALLYANQTENDILLRKELDELALKYPDQFQVWYTVDKAPANWKFSEGFINVEMIKEHLLPPSPDTIVLMCGPPPMIKFACHPHLDTLGYSADLRFTY